MKHVAWDAQLIEMCHRYIGPGFSRFGQDPGQVPNRNYNDKLFRGLWDLTATDVPPEIVVEKDLQRRFAQRIREYDRSTSGYQRAKL